MMNNLILTKYKIIFEQVEPFGKIMSSPFPVLNQLAYDTKSQSDIEDTIGAIDLVLGGQGDNINFVTDSMVTVDMYPEITNVYDYPDYKSNLNTRALLTIPTHDLRKIIAL